MALTPLEASAQKKTGTTTKKTTTTSAKKTTAAATPKATGAPLTKASAGKIIAMTNSMVDLYNEHIREIKDVQDCIKRFENTMDAVAKNPKGSAHGASCSNINPIREDMRNKLENNAKLAPAFPEKAIILENVDKVAIEFETAKASMAAIRKSIEKDKVATPAVKTALKKIYNDDDRHERFFKYAGEALDATDKFVEYLDPEKEITDVDHVLNETVEEARARNLKKHYNEIKNRYELMIYEYNIL